MMIQYRYLKNVATLALDAEKCVGCGRCTEVCPHGVFDITDNKAQITDKDLCMECGACALNCPAEAIEVSAGVGSALRQSLRVGLQVANRLAVAPVMATAHVVRERRIGND